MVFDIFMTIAFIIGRRLEYETDPCLASDIMESEKRLLIGNSLSFYMYYSDLHLPCLCRYRLRHIQCVYMWVERINSSYYDARIHVLVCPKLKAYTEHVQRVVSFHYITRRHGA